MDLMSKDSRFGVIGGLCTFNSTTSFLLCVLMTFALNLLSLQTVIFFPTKDFYWGGLHFSDAPMCIVEKSENN